MELFLISVSALVLWAVSAAVRQFTLDGYRRVPTRCQSSGVHWR